MTKNRTIEHLIEAGFPKARLARKIGIRRQELYAYLEPAKYPDVHLSDEKLKKIAAFEGRSLSAVRDGYLAKVA